MSKPRPPLFDAVIFDIDNVLVDTRRSYLDAIRWTVEIFLTHGKVPFFHPSKRPSEPRILSRRDVDQFKLLGGFNDDWDCCYGLLIYLLNLPVKSWATDHLKTFVNLEGLAKRVKKRPFRVAGIVEMFGPHKFVTIEKIARIFQEVYLGKDLFPAMERRKCLYWKRRGLIFKEKPIFRRSIFEGLRKRGLQLGIATGRPRFEALYVLRRFGLSDFFDALTTINEVKKAEAATRESLRKPHPFSLIETARQLGSKKRFLYVGDLPDDILAANRAKSVLEIRSATFPWISSHPEKTLEEIQNVHPDFILNTPFDLVKIVDGR